MNWIFASIVAVVVVLVIGLLVEVYADNRYQEGARAATRYYEQRLEALFDATERLDRLRAAPGPHLTPTLKRLWIRTDERSRLP